MNFRRIVRLAQHVHHVRKLSTDHLRYRSAALSEDGAVEDLAAAEPVASLEQQNPHLRNSRPETRAQKLRKRLENADFPAAETD